MTVYDLSDCNRYELICQTETIHAIKEENSYSVILNNHFLLSPCLFMFTYVVLASVLMLETPTLNYL